MEALLLEGVEDPGSVHKARAHLDGLRVTNPNRERMSREKLARVREELHRAFLWHCSQSTCELQAGASGAPLLLVSKQACAVCGGSNTRRAVHELLEQCQAAGIRRVCLVGGSPSVREALLRELGQALKLTLVDGTRTPSSGQARAHVRNHDVTVICGGSELSHKLSHTYEACQRDGHVITASRRGVEAIAEALGVHARGRLARA
jgi:hypothetical protein